MIVRSPLTRNITAGVTFFALFCNATGYPIPSIEWTVNGTSSEVAINLPLEDQQSNSNYSALIVRNPRVIDSGIYQCIATNVVNTDTRDANVAVQC